MVDTQLLDEKIHQSGYKIDHIVNTLGMSRNAFHKKRLGKTPFRTSEVYVLCDLLKINDVADKTKIFYPDSQAISGQEEATT